MVTGIALGRSTRSLTMERKAGIGQGKSRTAAVPSAGPVNDATPRQRTEHVPSWSKEISSKKDCHKPDISRPENFFPSMKESRMLDFWQILWFGVGFAAVLSALYALGITQGRRLSQKAWVIVWLAFSVALVVFIVGAFAFQSTLISTAVGGAVGYIVAVGAHVAAHTLDELRKEAPHQD